MMVHNPYVGNIWKYNPLHKTLSRALIMLGSS